jgi:serine/tyrosine/threonine adenylyltransferase
MNLNIHNTFNKELPADKVTDNDRREVLEACFSSVLPKIPAQPSLIHVSDVLAQALGISKQDYESEDFLQLFSGSTIYSNTTPYAMCYGGHQFGNWAGQLGDGRAINLFEIAHKGKNWAFQLKGAGETPYSRSADGLAVLRSSIREHLCSEAMHHLGVPTTRSLTLMLTGDQVLRDVLYNGNPAYEKGAVICRVAPSFIRFGNFEILAARQDYKNLTKLADYTLKYFYPEIKSTGKEAYLALFEAISHHTLDMIVHWQRVGFVHGVMNTDNMSALGLTIDYGPYGWLEGFDPNWTPNTTDAQGRRYRFGNQPDVAVWNLLQLANALYPIIGDIPALEQTLNQFGDIFSQKHKRMMLEKLGLQNNEPHDLVDKLFKIMQYSETDYTIFFRKLADVSKEDRPEIALEKISFAFYNLEEISGEIKNQWLDWLAEYKNLLLKESDSDLSRKIRMNAHNPKYVLRNYMAQLAIEAAETGDYQIINEFYELLKEPYSEQPQSEKWFAKRPDWAKHKVGSSMLSCSS